MAIVAEGDRGRIYLSPDNEHERIAASAKPEWKPETELSTHPQYMGTPRYGMTRHCDLFTNRQLVALNTFSDLVSEVKEAIKKDAIANGIKDDGLSLSSEGTSATAYSDAVATYLGFAVDRLSDRNSTICSWDVSRDSTRNTFARQSISMTWDYVETNPLSDSTGNFVGASDWVVKVIELSSCNSKGFVRQADATNISGKNLKPIIVSTDPPYYDAVPYSDLSDFFYVWMRRSLNKIHPELFTTLATPKEAELVADQHRHGSRVKAQKFFEDGLEKVFTQVRKLLMIAILFLSITLLNKLKAKQYKTGQATILLQLVGKPCSKA